MTSMLKSPLLKDAYPVVEFETPIHLSRLGIMEIVRDLDHVDDDFVRAFSLSDAEYFRWFAERIERVNKPKEATDADR